MKTQELRAALAAERRRREEAEAKLSRALENNTALARGNLRLQEQCARLRGEADLRQHEEGCQRAAAAAREQEVSAKLARLQALVRRGAEERETLLRQLAGKQEVIAYLEGKLAERAAAADTNGGGSVQLGAASATPAAAADAAANVKADGQVVQRSQSPAGSLDAAAPVPAGREPRQRVPLGASEVEEAPSVGEVSSGTPAGPELAGDSGAADAGGGEDAEQEASKRAGASRSLAPAAAAVGEEAQQSRPRQLPSLPAAAAEQTPAPPRKQQQTGSNSTTSGVAPPTIQRTSLRARNSISYAEPSLSRKLRQGDPFTFGVDEAAAAGGSKPRGRARTKPRPRFAAGTAQHSSEGRREALPPLAD